MGRGTDEDASGYMPTDLEKQNLARIWDAHIDHIFHNFIDFKKAFDHYNTLATLKNWRVAPKYTASILFHQDIQSSIRW